MEYMTEINNKQRRGMVMLRVDKREARTALQDDYLKCKLISIKQQDTHFRKNYKFYQWIDKMLEQLQLLFQPNAHRLKPDLCKHMTDLHLDDEMDLVELLLEM